MELSGRRPVLIVTTVFAMLAVALTLFIASRDTPNAQAVGVYEATYMVKNCNDLPPITPWTTFGIAGADLHGPGGTGSPDGIPDCNPGQDPRAGQVLPDAAGAPAGPTDLSTRLCVPGRAAVVDCPALNANVGAMNFSDVINYIPNGYQLNCSPNTTNPSGACPGTMPADAGLGANLAVGELIGGGDNSVNLQAVTQGQCTSNFNVPFIFYNVALPSVGIPGAPSVFGNPDPRTSANIAFPRNEGHTDRYGAWQTGSAPADGDANNVVDTAGGADNKADSTTLSIQQYPSYLLDLFDPDFIPGVGDNADGGPNLPPVVPVAVYGGMTQPVPASTDWTPLYFVQFAPGQLANGAGTWGGAHPFSTYTANKGAPNVVVLNDPTSVKASVSAIQDFCSVVRSTTMLLGTGGSGHVRYKPPVSSGTYNYINKADSLRDADGDGRENSFDTCPLTADGPVTWDTDGDGINDSCDPNPAVAAAIDVDGDGFSNEQDNCPLVANGLAPVDPGDNGQKETELTLLAWPADGGPKTDSIGDLCDPSPSVPNGDYKTIAATTPTVVRGNGPRTSPCTAFPTVFGDTDCDGFTSAWETYMGTSPTSACGGASAWPPDNNGDAIADLSDILRYIPVFGKIFGGLGFLPRFDMNADHTIDLTDILMFIPYFGLTCP